MEFIIITAGGLFVIGTCIAIYEIRRGRPFHIEHITDDPASEPTKFGEKIKNRTYLDLMR
jgi:hypothetical protein